MEMALVLAVLIAIAALAWPALGTPLGSARLRKAAEQVRADWAHARVEAMLSGATQVFHFEPETGRYRVSPWTGLDPVQAATSEAELMPAAPLAGSAWDNFSELPEGIKFYAGQTQADSRALAFASSTEGQETIAVGADPILFYPDGTSTTSTIVLSGENEMWIELKLRGLTGIATVSDVNSAEDVR